MAAEISLHGEHVATIYRDGVFLCVKWRDKTIDPDWVDLGLTSEWQVMRGFDSVWRALCFVCYTFDVDNTSLVAVLTDEDVEGDAGTNGVVTTEE